MEERTGPAEVQLIQSGTFLQLVSTARKKKRKKKKEKKKERERRTEERERDEREREREREREQKTEAKYWLMIKTLAFDFRHIMVVL